MESSRVSLGKLLQIVSADCDDHAEALQFTCASATTPKGQLAFVLIELFSRKEIFLFVCLIEAEFGGFADESRNAKSG